MFAQADYSPNSSPEAITRVNGFINRAYKQLSLEAPFMFFESKVHLATEPDSKSLSDDDTVSIVQSSIGTEQVEPFTFKTDYTTVQQAASPTTLTDWKIDRSWDGRMIEFTTSDGTLVHNQIRSVWKNTSDNKIYFTLVRPYDNDFGTANLKFRVYSPYYALPDDVIQLKSARLRDVDNNYPLDVLGQQEAEERQLDGPTSQVASGIPRVIFRRGHQKMRGPSVPPVATLDTETVGTGEAADAFKYPWFGPEPPGTFEYVVTYTWGKRDTEFMLPGLAQWNDHAVPFKNTDAKTFASKSPASGNTLSTTPLNAARNRYREPRFESAPSPASNKVAHTYTSSAAIGTLSSPYAAVKISLPNSEYAMGYLNKFIEGASTTKATRDSLHQSGVYVRIYRKRTSTSLGHYNEMKLRADGLSTSQLDSAEAFYLLAEFRVEDTNGGVFYDDGQIMPDYDRRLRDVHGYQTMQFYPKPDKRYVTDIRCVLRPNELVDDDDTPVIHPEALNVLIQRSMALFYENLGQPQLSQVCYANYREELLTLSKRYGDLRPPGVPVLRRMTRAQSSYRSNNYYRKWYTTS